MKTNTSFRSFGNLPYAFLILLFPVFSISLSAQLPDLTVLEISLPEQVIFADQTTPFEGIILNQGAGTAFGVPVSIQVMPGPVFIYNTTIAQLDPGQTILLSELLPPPQEWLPPVGFFDVIVDIPLPPSADENPTNNTMVLPVEAQPQFPIQLEQLDLVSHLPLPILNSTYIQMCVTFPALEDPLFLNLMVQDPIGGDEAWGVQNMPLLPFDGDRTICYWFDSSALGFSEGDDVPNLNTAMRLDPQMLPAPFPPPLWNPVPVLDLEYNIGLDNPVVPVIPFQPPALVTFPFWDPLPPLDFLYRGCTVPNIDLDNSTNPISPGYAGDLNACGPAAAANSLQWLEDTHPEIDANGQTHREKMEDLSGLMGRGNGEGVTTQQLVMGKLAFIDKHQLPIHVKYQSWFDSSEQIASPNPIYPHSGENKGGVGVFEPPTWEFLKSEMEKGEDVEIMFGWYDKMANRNGGHWVTVTGTFESGDNKGIYIKDDGNQDNATGTRETYHPWHTDDDWSRLLGFDGPNNYCWVESVVSESYDPTITHKVFSFDFSKLSPFGTSMVPQPGMSLFTFSFPPNVDPQFLNIKANWPGQPELWVTRNIMLPPGLITDTLSVFIDLGRLGPPPLDDDTLQMKLGVDADFSVDSFFDIAYTIDFDVNAVDYFVGNGAIEPLPDVLPIIPTGLPIFNLDLPAHVYRGCEIPNIDLDSTSHNPTNTPGYAGDLNACGPAGAANSMQWLDNTNPNINSMTTHREKLKELSGYMDRGDNEGVFRKNFIEAKLAYIDNHELPIHVKFQGFYFDKDSIPSPDTLYGHFAENKNDTAFAKPQWDFLVQEMQNDEDIELEFGCYYNGVRLGGHWVTISGVSEVGGTNSIYYKDDIDQWKKGGTGQRQLTWVTDETTGLSYLSEISTPDTIYVVESIVSESYDPDVKFCPINLTVDEDPIPSGTYSASNSIKVSGKIPAGADVIISSPKIELIDLEVELTGTLTTESTGCGGD